MAEPVSALNIRFLLQHPAHFIALGAGSGLVRHAPGTAGTLAAFPLYALSLVYCTPLQQLVLIAGAFVLGIWACARTGESLGVADPGAIVWDEIVAFWIVLWVVTPAPWWVQLLAFGLFRYFDAAKPGPVAWADQRFKRRLVDGSPEPIGHRQGFGILFDDLVAALCTLLLMAAAITLLRTLWNS